MSKRLVSIELLRVVAMLMVMGLHANFLALKIPSAEMATELDGLVRVFAQSACVMAVDVFVMISGWFGIRSSLKGFCNFMWQVLFFVGLAYLVEFLFFGQHLGIREFCQCFGLYDGGGWFVASYIGLYILSPVLNAYVERTEPRKIAYMLAAFFAFELLWGNTLSVGFIIAGYSTFSFIGIYILAGLLRKMQLQYRASTYLLVFFGCVVVNALIYAVCVRCGFVALRDMVFNYINPLVIVAAGSLLLAFSRFTPPNASVIQRVTLWLGASCFAAYLVHVGTGFALAKYCDGVEFIYDSLSGITAFFAIVAYILIVFVGAVILDQPRKLIWKKLLLPLFK